MLKITKKFSSFISIILLSILICNSLSASAAVVTNTIENKIIQEITYPLQIDTCLIENNESNEFQTN